MRMLDTSSEGVEKEKLKAIGLQNEVYSCYVTVFYEISSEYIYTHTLSLYFIQVHSEISKRMQKKTDLESQVCYIFS